MSTYLKDKETEVPLLLAQRKLEVSIFFSYVFFLFLYLN